MAALVAAALRDAGERPAVLSRGYGRRHAEDGVVVVRDPGGVRADLDRAGDEPLMLARNLDGVAVLASSSRFLAGRLAETQFGCTVHVLDDGFQHFDVHRSADLVIVAREDFERPVTLPSGRLREPLDAAAAADALVWLDQGPEDGGSDGGSEDPPYASHVGRVLRPGIPVWRARRTQPPAASAEPVFAVAGIASPASFFAALRANGWTIAGELAFRDHHRYSRADLGEMLARARAAGATRVVTTEKDLVRLLPFRPFAMAIDAVPVTLTLEDAAGFAGWLLAAVASARAGEAGGAKPPGQR